MCSCSCGTDEKCATLSSDRELRYEMTSYKQLWSNSIGYEIKFGLFKRYSTVTLRDFKIHFGIKYYIDAYLIRLSFLSYLVLLAESSRPKTHREVRWKKKFEKCLAKIYFNKYQNCFFNAS